MSIKIGSYKAMTCRKCDKAGCTRGKEYTDRQEHLGEVRVWSVFICESCLREAGNETKD
jgi:hypothetical protein